MKKIFTLTLMAAAAGAMVAQPKVNMSKATVTPEQVRAIKEAKKVGAVSAKPSQKQNIQRVDLAGKTFTGAANYRGAKLDRNAVKPFTPALKALDMAADELSVAQKPASTETGAFYSVENALKVGIFYNEDNGGFVNYYTPYLISQAFFGTYNPTTRGMWSINGEDASKYIDGEGNFSKLLFGQAGGNVGGYYTPTITSKTGNAYYYGADGSDAGTNYEYSVNFQASETDPLSVGVYDLYDIDGFYTGFSNTYAFGSRDFDTDKGQHISSNTTIIDFGNTGNGLEISGIEFRGLSKYEDPFQNCSEDEAYISVTIIDHNPAADNADEDGNVYYYGIIDETSITPMGVIATGDYAFLVQGVFTEIDEDGFASEVTPVVQGDEMTLVLSNFAKANMGIFMTYTDNMDDYPSHSYYDQWVDGVQSEGFYTAASYAIDAVVNLQAVYNFIGGDQGEKVLEGVAPVEVGPEGYSWVVSTVADGKEYNDFDLLSTFTDPENDWDIDVDNEEMVAGVDYQLDYIDEYGIIPFYIACTALPEGVAGRECNVTITSHGSASVTIHVVQGDPSGLNSVAADKAGVAAYNLMGQKVLNTNAAGLYLVNGKKIMK